MSYMQYLKDLRVPTQGRGIEGARKYLAGGPRFPYRTAQDTKELGCRSFEVRSQPSPEPVDPHYCVCGEPAMAGSDFCRWCNAEGY